MGWLFWALILIFVISTVIACLGLIGVQEWEPLYAIIVALGSLLLVIKQYCSKPVPIPVEVKFDIFISYEKEDSQRAEALIQELEERGVRCFCRDRARPGTPVSQLLEEGLASSRVVGLVITPQSKESGWVEDEYKRIRDLLMGRKMHLIPLLFGNVDTPSSLSQLGPVDFRDQSKYGQSVDHLIWPGITGQRVMFYGAFEHELRGSPIESWCRHRNIRFNLFSDFGRLYEDIDLQRSSSDGHFKDYRIVVVVDIYCGWPRWGKDSPEDNERIQSRVEKMFDLREKTMNTPNKLIFLLCEHSTAWDHRAKNVLDKSTREKLENFFRVYWDDDSKKFRKRMDNIWIHIQKDLLKAYHSHPFNRKGHS